MQALIRLVLVAGAVSVAGCGGDAEDNLRSLPDRMAALARDGEIDEAMEYVADDFQGGGITREQLGYFVRQYLGSRKPFVVHVGVDAEEEGQDTRSLTILGVFGPANMDSAKAKSLRPFRVEARVRADGDDWLVVGARLVR